jgi:hypothetical protein
MDESQILAGCCLRLRIRRWGVRVSPGALNLCLCRLLTGFAFGASRGRESRNWRSGSSMGDGVAVVRSRRRGQADRRAGYRGTQRLGCGRDETGTLPDADMSVNTAELDPTEAVAAIHSRVQALAAYWRDRSNVSHHPLILLQQCVSN